MSKLKLQLIDFIFIALLVIYGVMNAVIITPEGYFRAGTKFDWPDETAAAFLTAQVAEHTSLSASEPLNAAAHGLIHPRSLNVLGEKLVPASFFGLPVLYGLLAKITGLEAVLYFTLIFFCLALYALYDILKRFGSPRWAFCSVLLVMAHPGLWYYALHSYLPNVLFLSLLILSAWLLVAKKNIWAGLVFGLALLVRLSELYWLGVLILGFMHLGRRQLSRRLILFFMAPVAALALFLLVVNHNVYGAWFNTGYGGLDGLVKNNASWLGLFFPFGLHLSWAWQNIMKYIYQLSPWYVWLASGGVGLLFWQKRQTWRIWWPAIIAILVAFVYLLVFYGSWVFVDSAIYRMADLGISYIRYWLPIYILLALLAGYFLAELSERLGRRGEIFALAATIMVAVLFYDSSDIVFVKYEDSFLKVKSRRETYQAINNMARKLLPPSAIIISSRSDKIFFPEFRVITLSDKPTSNSPEWPYLQILSKDHPLYYYNGERLEKL